MVKIYEIKFNTDDNLPLNKPFKVGPVNNNC